ncbi:MAG: hypothetical protein LBP61_08540 [Desulfovibrio sp.]|jgi:hypothetical protein|nr:hypothetical protein [Desulfovibrio sp.]
MQDGVCVRREEGTPRGGELRISPESLVRFKNQIRFLTRRNQGKAFERIIERLNSYLDGWFAYYQYGCRPMLPS